MQYLGLSLYPLSGVFSHVHYLQHQLFSLLC